MEDKKPKAKNAFMSSIAKNMPLTLEDMNQKKDPLADSNIENVEASIVPTVLKSNKKKQSEKHLDFIANIVKSPNTDFDKGYIYVSGLTHQRLKKLANMTNVNLYELTDSIMNDFFEKNKENIEVLIKKYSF